MSNFVNLDGNTKVVAGWIWKNLVPKSGQSETVQGELLRAVEKLCWEAQNNGNGNWDDRFEMFINFLSDTLTSEHRIPGQIRDALTKDLAILRNYHEPYTEDDLFDRLTEIVIAYCRLNPALIKLAHDSKQYR